MVDLLRREGVEVWPPSTKTRGDRTRRRTRLAPRVCCGEAPACFTRRRRRPHLGAARRGAPAPPPAPAARSGASSSGRVRGPGSLRSPRPVSAGCPALCPRLRQDSWQVNADDVSSRDRPKPHALPPPRLSRHLNAIARPSFPILCPNELPEVHQNRTFTPRKALPPHRVPWAIGTASPVSSH